MKKFQIFLMACMIGSAASAQNFMLYSFKGNVSVVENSVESKAKVGKPLTASSTVKVGAGGTVTLICNEAAMFTLSKTGTYSLNKFSGSCRPSSNSVSANYVKYVWASMTKTSGSAGSNRKQYMNTVGAVTRGGMNNVWIDERLGIDTVYYSGNGGDFPFSWKSYNDAKSFDFYVYPMDDITTPVLKMTVDKLKVPLKDIVGKLKPGNSYFWTAAVKGETNETMYKLNYVTKETFSKLLNNLKKQLGSYESPAEEAYRLGFMLEDARYLADAYEYYKKAAELDNTSVLYRSTLMAFKKDYEIK